MATTTNDGSGWTNVSGTAFASTANAYDGSATTYATCTTTTTGNHVGEVTGYDFASTVPSDATLNSVVVNVQQYVSNASRWNNPTIQAYDGTTAIGSATTLTERTSAGNEDVTITGITLAQVRSANFKMRFTANKANTTSAIQYFGWANVTVDYTPAPQTLVASGISTTPTLGSVTLSQTTTFPQTLVASAISSSPSVPTPVLDSLPPAQTLVASGITNTATVGTPTLGVGAVTLQAAGISSSPAVASPDIRQQAFFDITSGIISRLGIQGAAGQTLQVAEITTTPTVGSVTVTAAATVVAGQITGTPTVPTPTVSAPATLTAAGITATPTVATPAVVTAATVQVAAISNTATVATPAVAVGAVTLQVAGIASTAAVGTPVIVQVGPDQTLVVAGITASPTVGTPVLAAATTVQAAGITATPTVATATLAATATLVVTEIASTALVPTPVLFRQDEQTLVVGAITVTPTVGSVTLQATVPMATDGISSSPTLDTPALSQVLRRIKRDTFEQVYTDRMPAARYGIDTQMSILLSGGVITVTDFPYQEDVEAADAFYQGGREYALSQAEYQALVDAGGSDLVEIV